MRARGETFLTCLFEQGFPRAHLGGQARKGNAVKATPKKPRALASFGLAKRLKIFAKIRGTPSYMYKWVEVHMYVATHSKTKGSMWSLSKCLFFSMLAFLNDGPHPGVPCN